MLCVTDTPLSHSPSPTAISRSLMTADTTPHNHTSLRLSPREYHVSLSNGFNGYACDDVIAHLSSHSIAGMQSHKS